MNPKVFPEVSTSLISVIGISMGDEGKGRVVHEILNQIHQSTGKHAAGVMKINGGANAGHTAAGLKLNLLPSGVGNPDVPLLLIAAGVVADPRKFLWEAKPLEVRGLSVIQRLLIDEKCQVSDLSHRLLDLAWENYRVKKLGQESRGSTNRGISPAYNDETGQWQIFYQSFLQDRKIFARKLKERFERAMRTIQFVCEVDENDWHGFFCTLSDAETKANRASIEQNIFPENEFSFLRFMGREPYQLDFDALESTYWQAGTKLIECIGDLREKLLECIYGKRVVVAEFGQAYWLDKRHGFSPNVTASHTTSNELFSSAGIPLQKVTQVACCKAYDTKVGTHHFITRLDHEKDPWGKKLARLEFGTSTGRQRMVGWFDAVEKGNALRYGGFDEIVINKLDALTLDKEVDEELMICTAYELPDGSSTKKVPRDEDLRKKLIPIYESFPGWKTDLTEVSLFDELPIEAKNYISRMITSLIEVAYREGMNGRTFPKIRFIGVGPDPGQIVRDVPPVETFFYETNAPHG